MKRLLLLPVLLLAATGLRAQVPAAQTPVPAQKPVAEKAAAQPPQDLAKVLDDWLRGPADGPQAAARLGVLHHWLSSEALARQLTSVAADTTEPPLVRARALIALGQEHPATVAQFDYALSDPDPTVRAAAAIALKPILSDPTIRGSAIVELRRALRDPSPAVVGRALEALGDNDAGVLREFLASKPPAGMAAVARQLIDLAESHGAPLAPRDSSGLLSRTVGDATLEFVPTQRWPQWDIAAGTVQVRRGRSAPVVLATGDQAVRNVPPATLSPDGRYVAYEKGGHMHVRDLQTGADRDVGAGIAPRAVGIAPGFLFARPGPVTSMRDRSSLEYSIMFAPWSGGEPRLVAKAAALAQELVNGNASGMRWARIVEGDGSFILIGDGLAAPVTLPDLTGLHG